MKTCTRCHTEKTLDNFSLRGDTGKHRSACKTCINASNIQRYHSNSSTKEAHRKASRKHGLKRYGLTEADFLQMFEEQGGKCKICETEIATISENRHQSSCVDHCHKTGKVRGLLCWNCNVGLGKFFDSPELIRNAINYLTVTRE